MNLELKQDASISGRLSRIFIVAMVCSFVLIAMGGYYAAMTQKKESELARFQLTKSIAGNLLQQEFEQLQLLAKHKTQVSKNALQQSGGISTVSLHFEKESRNANRVLAIAVFGGMNERLQLRAHRAFDLEQNEWLTILENKQSGGVIVDEENVYIYVRHKSDTDIYSPRLDVQTVLITKLSDAALFDMSNLLESDVSLLFSKQNDSNTVYPYDSTWRWETLVTNNGLSGTSGVVSIHTDASDTLPIQIAFALDGDSSILWGFLGWLMPLVVVQVILTIVIVEVLKRNITTPISELLSWLKSADIDNSSKQLAPFKFTQNSELKQLGEQFYRVYDGLYEQHLFSQILLYSISDIIVTVDAHGRIDYCNPAGVEWFGFSEQQIQGQFLELIMSSYPSKEHLSNWVHCALEFGKEHHGVATISRLSNPIATCNVNIQVNPLIQNNIADKGAMVILRAL